MRRELCWMLAITVASSAHAADWVLVHQDRLRRVELDRSTIFPTDGGARVAWGRIVLPDARAQRFGYRSVRVLNRYECQRASLKAIRRVYLSDDERTLREEVVDAQAPIPIRRGSVDERFYRQVCQPISSDALRDIAREAASRAKDQAR